MFKSYLGLDFFYFQALDKGFKPGDRVLVPVITPDWNSKAIFIGNRIGKQKIRKVLFKNSERIKILPSGGYSRPVL